MESVFRQSICTLELAANDAGLHSIGGRFAASLENAMHFEMAMDILQDLGQQLGYSLVDYAYSYAARSPDGSWLPNKMKTRNFPLNWDHDWSRHSAHDPFFHLSFAGTMVEWHDVIHDADALQPEERDCLWYICDWMPGDGVTVPINTYGNHFASISLLGHRDGSTRFHPAQAGELAMLANYFHNTVQARFRLNRPHDMEDLSARELETLSWCAHGKSIDDIATIMGISPETVRIYLKRANRKLNALNRPHAVAKAMLLGIIKPPQLL